MDIKYNNKLIVRAAGETQLDEVGVRCDDVQDFVGTSSTLEPPGAKIKVVRHDTPITTGIVVVDTIDISYDSDTMRYGYVEWQWFMLRVDGVDTIPGRVQGVLRCTFSNNIDWFDVNIKQDHVNDDTAYFTASVVSDSGRDNLRFSITAVSGSNNHRWDAIRTTLLAQGPYTPG